MGQGPGWRPRAPTHGPELPSVGPRCNRRPQLPRPRPRHRPGVTLVSALPSPHILHQARPCESCEVWRPPPARKLPIAWPMVRRPLNPRSPPSPPSMRPRKALALCESCEALRWAAAAASPPESERLGWFFRAASCKPKARRTRMFLRRGFQRLLPRKSCRAMCKCRSPQKAGPCERRPATHRTERRARYRALRQATRHVLRLATCLSTSSPTPRAKSRATPGAAPRATPLAKPLATLQATPHNTPHNTPLAKPLATLRATPHNTPQATPWAAPRARPWATPLATPQAFRAHEMSSNQPARI
mmetsp:Transcript_54488/g.151874  ORF Transcript_54488/g.151874 Transcript_54488/m.151874 type:complete len:302 (-) Transcript_54488:2294-3199(-)